MALSRHMTIKMLALVFSLVLLSTASLWGLDTLGGPTDPLSGEVQAISVVQLRAVLAAMMLLCIVTILLVTGVLVSQYRGVIRPLRQLHAGLRQIAEGDFKQRLQVSGPAEISELAADFNALAEELDSLHADLDRKALARSREMVRSERLASVGFLAAGVAHEINNPLNIITGYAELSLREADRLPDPRTLADIKQALQIIREEGFRCKSITEKLLALARSSSRSRQAVSLARVAQDVVALIQTLSQFHDRQVRLAFGTGDPLVVWGNENELRQVVLNLTVNALEAVPAGVGQVVLRGARHNGGIEFTVIDNGRGMTPEVLEHAFEPFFSDRRPDRERGIGMGLSIANAIVEAHGGHVIAESDGPGLGSRFTIHLPSCGKAQAGSGQAA